MKRSVDRPASSPITPRAQVNMPGRALALAVGDSFPPGPHPDGLLLVDDNLMLWYWDAPSNQWRRTVRN